MQSADNNPLQIQEKDVTGEDKKSQAGSTAKRYFTVYNLGAQDAEINISVTASDEKSELIQDWCAEIDPNPVKLKAWESCDVSLIFEIPQQAKPDLYRYEILLEAPEQYPDKFFRSPQELLVSRLEQGIEWGDPPKITLDPHTSSTNSYRFKAGEKLTVKVKIENRSLLVDSFELSCPDLEPDWFTINYPERELELPGLVMETEGLKLNPGRKGEISLTLHPPQLTLAGNYIRTIQIISKNRTDLVLLDALYIQILPNDRLGRNNVTISPASRRVPQQPGEFEISVFNPGNIVRDLTLGIGDGGKAFRYAIEPEQIRLLPGQSRNASLIAKSRWFMRWCRPLWGEGAEIEFEVELKNTNEFVIPETQKPPALPRDKSQGQIIWSARPWWQLLLLILLALSALGATIFYLWWQFLRLPPLPRIEAFETTKTTNSETDEESVLLNWRISNLEEIDKIAVVSTDGKNQKNIQNYDEFETCKADKLQDCLPKQLNQLCKVEGDNLNCQKLSLGALTPGKYTFELQVFPKKVKKLFRQRNPNQASDSVVTDTLAIAPIPIPQIARQRGLVASKSTYKKAQAEVVKLEWEITEIGKLQKLNVIRQGKDGKIDVYPYSIAENKKELIATNLGQRRDRLKCSVSGKETKKCQWTISSTDIVAGDSTFKVELFSSKDEEKPSDTLATKNTIAIVPVPLPAIEQFASARTIYKEGSESIKLNWSVKNPQQIEALIVKAISQNGSSQEVARYQYPSQTSKFCPTPKKAQDLLLCNNVSINSLPAGDYTFQLIVDPKQEQKEVEITQKTDTVKIESQPFEIVSFKVNGEEVKQGDTSLHARNKGIPVILDLAWSVKGNKDLKVEVLPLEGEQQASGSLQYTLPPETNRESITLRVTNQQGEQKTRSIQVQAYESKSPSQSSVSETRTDTRSNSQNPEIDESKTSPSPPSEPPSEPAVPEPLEVDPLPN